MDIIAVQLINGLSYGMLLFMITCGLSLVFGLLGVLNLTHGSLFLLGTYMALSIMKATGNNFWVALIIAPILVAVVSWVMEIGLLRPTYHLGHLPQVLLTIGLAYMLHDLIRLFWGSNIQSLPMPASLDTSVNVFGHIFPLYRLIVMLFGFAVFVVLYLFQEKTKWGAIVRAGLSNKEMVSGLGINIKLVFTGVFLFGAALAGLGGVLSGPILGMFPGMEFDILILALVVLVVGGLNTIIGTLVASLLIGLMDTFGKVMFPEFSMFIIYALMALILIFKPTGLLGKV